MIKRQNVCLPQIGHIDGIGMSMHQYYKIIISYQYGKNQVLDLGTLFLDGLSNGGANSQGQRQHCDSVRKEIEEAGMNSPTRTVVAHQMLYQSLASGQHTPQIKILSLFKYPGEVCVSQNGENLMVNIATNK